MRRGILLSSMLLIAAMAAAQYRQRFSIHAEGSAGLTFARVKSWENGTTFSTAPAFSAGLSFVYHFRKAKGLSLKTILAYEKKNVVMLLSPSWTEAELHYHYLTLPVLAEYSFGKKDRFNANAGMYFSYLLKSKGEHDDYPGDDRTSMSNRFDMGIVAGMGVTVNFKHWLPTTFGVRSSVGVFNIDEADIIRLNTLSLVTSFRIYRQKPAPVLITPRFF